MKRISEKGIQQYLKSKYNLAIGELTATKLSIMIKTLLDESIKIKGRSYKTGNKKRIKVTLGAIVQYWFSEK